MERKEGRMGGRKEGKRKKVEQKFMVEERCKSIIRFKALTEHLTFLRKL